MKSQLLSGFPPGNLSRQSSEDLKLSVMVRVFLYLNFAAVPVGTSAEGIKTLAIGANQLIHVVLLEGRLGEPGLV